MERKETGREKDAHTLEREALRASLQLTPVKVHLRLHTIAGGGVCTTLRTQPREARKTFAAGCQPRCLTTVLGGVGTQMERLVKADEKKKSKSTKR